ncbi:MAG: toxin-antitoxin system HicB family antitoxin [Streptosporangiales bacterium]|nr:toxin-antitoxin system HicB family antitoxin [Streptosporangiales bacterium]MBO0889826.1 toxin-antitoxin system HicB family antitoxin [Acidothermales bacterium]
MNLMPYVAQLRHELGVAAQAGGEESRAVAERLVAPLESATRLCLLDALTAAADEITRDLAPGSVEVRLRGRDPDFVVTPPPAEQTTGSAESGSGGIRGALASAIEVTMGVRPPAASEGDEGGTSRITLRLPEQLKPRIEQAAAREGMSVNAWLVRAVSAAVEVTDPATAPGQRAAPLGQHFTGWVR